MKKQIKRLPNIPIWDNLDMAKSFIYGVIVGLVISWII